MINNNVLETRLNNHKLGKDIPTEEYIEDLEQLDAIQDKISLITKISHEIIGLSFVVSETLAFGYASKAIFTTDWKFGIVIAVGYSIHLITSKFFNLIKR